MPTDGSPIGDPRPRIEDRALVTGEARFVADIDAAAAEAVFVRSFYAHGELGPIETEDARAVPGVVAVLTAADLAGLPATPGPPGVEVPAAMERPLLARDRVRFAGEPFAVVLAEDLAVALDAAELVSAEIDPLEAVIDPTVASTSPTHLFPGHDNVATTHSVGADVTDALAAAPVRIELDVRQPRLAPAPIETRRILVVPDGDRLTVWCSHQAPHRLQGALAAVFGLERLAVRVIAPEVGGAFGAKSQTWPEYVVVAHLARTLGRPVRWVEGRSESFLAGSHGRGQHQHLSLGADHEGRILALHIRIDADMGAYPQTGAVVPPNTALVLSGPYRIPALHVEIRSVVTNATPTAPYRGAGRPEASFVLERAIDELARRCSLDPAEVRRRNFIPRDAFPYHSPTGAIYDSGDYAAALELALRRAGYDEVRRQQADRSDHDRLLGVGIGSYVERSGGSVGSTEFGSVEVGADGAVLARTGSSAQGQGHRTAFAQIVAAALEADADEVTVVQGDTAAVPSGVGTFASRSMQVGGTTLHRAATDLIDRARELAAETLEVDPDDLIYHRMGFEIAGSPAPRVSLADVARTHGTLLVEATVPSAQAFPFGTCVAVVEIDRETGRVTLRDLVSVDDCGTVINPLLAQGQTHGSLVQGIGQALFEVMAYDGTGEPLSTTFAEYAIVSAADVPALVTDSMQTPAPTGIGAKGAGESGCIGAPPAIVNAVADALRGHDLSALAMPVTSEQIWRILHPAVERAIPRRDEVSVDADG